MDLLREIFGVVCGRGHLCLVGGVALPFCQRCAGLYAGCVWAAICWLAFRPRPGRRVLWIHTGFLLIMAPFGYHWVQHGEAIRILTGYLFAVGLVYLLALNPAEQYRRREGRTRNEFLYFSAVSAGAPLLLAAIYWGGERTAVALSIAGAAGLLLYFVLVIANLIVLPRIAWQALRSRLKHA